jgi:putative two-component system response regulator
MTRRRGITMTDRQRRKGSVVVVDDTDVTAEVLRRHLVADGYTVEVACDGPSGLEAVRRTCPDLVLLDVMMPGMSGFELCRRLKADPVTRLTPVVLVTSLDGRDDRLEGVEAGADDFLTKPVDVRQLKARVRALLRVKHCTDDLDSAEEVLLNLGRTVETRDPSTEGHCERLAAYALAMGAELSLGPEDLQALYRGALIHDVGKIAVPDAVLLKPGPLTSAEYEVMKRHTIVGEMLCADFRAFRSVRPIVRHHHERIDGSGYPDRLVGAAVPLLAQMVGILDVFDALTTARPYRPALSFAAAMECLRDEVARGLHDRALVDILDAMRQSGELERAAASTLRLAGSLSGARP